MLQKEAWATLGFTLLGAWLSYIAGSAIIAWICGFAGIVILIVLLSRQQEEKHKSFIPTRKEIYETAEAKSRSMIADIDLERKQRQKRIEGYVDFFGQDLTKKINEAKERGLVFNRPQYIEHPKAQEGENQQEY